MIRKGFKVEVEIDERSTNPFSIVICPGGEINSNYGSVQMSREELFIAAKVLIDFVLNRIIQGR